jgi:hypothetical protein
VVLIPLPPEEPRPPVRRPRRRRIRPGLVLAAAAVAAVGIAWGVSSAKRGTPALGDVSFAPRGRNARAATPDGGGSLATAGADTLSPAQLAMRIAADSFDVSDSDMSTKSAPPANAASKPAPDSGAAKPAARDTSAARSRVTTSAAQAPSRAAARPPTTKAPLPPDREAAARATQELDREIRRQRAAQATAQLDRSQQHPTSTAHPATSGAAAVSAAASPDTSDDDASDSGSARPDSAAAAPAPAAPRPPSLDEQLGLERRIGLDEAAKILGEPVHVIDGMHALAVGVVDGGSVPGADATRPVVRVGYISQSGALVMLDQQRVRTLVGRSREPGAGPAGPRLLVGDILIYLHGRAPAEELRDLADRVR